MGSGSIQNFESPDSDPFIEFTPDKTGDLPYSYSIGLLSIGESLFLLRSTSDFGEICRRFKDRDLRSTFFELFAAMLFHNRNLKYMYVLKLIRKEKTLIFRCHVLGRLLIVEVTALTVPDASLKTIHNALEAKRKQLPTDAPSIVFYVFPKTWNRADATETSALAKNAERALAWPNSFPAEFPVASRDRFECRQRPV